MGAEWKEKSIVTDKESAGLGVGWCTGNVEWILIVDHGVIIGYARSLEGGFYYT